MELKSIGKGNLQNKSHEMTSAKQRIRPVDPIITPPLPMSAAMAHQPPINYYTIDEFALSKRAVNTVRATIQSVYKFKSGLSLMMSIET